MGKTSSPTSSFSSASIPIPKGSLKRPATDAALSPDAPKQSPHIPRTPTARGYSGFVKREQERVSGGDHHGRDGRDVDNMEFDSNGFDEDDSFRSKTLVFPDESGDKLSQLYCREMPPIRHATQSEMREHGTATADEVRNSPSVTQLPDRNLAQNPDLLKWVGQPKEDGTYYLVAQSWLAQSQTQSPTPVDNSSLLEPGASELRPDLKEGFDYISVSAEAWEAIANRHGLVNDTSAVSRQTYMGADGRWHVDLYPASFDVRYSHMQADTEPVASIMLFRQTSPKQIRTLLSEKLNLNPSTFGMSLIRSNGEKISIKEGQPLTQSDLGTASWIEIIPQVEHNLPSPSDETPDSVFHMEDVVRTAEIEDTSDAVKPFLSVATAEPTTASPKTSPKILTKRERVLRKLNGGDEGEQPTEGPPLMLEYGPAPPEDVTTAPFANSNSFNFLPAPTYSRPTSTVTTGAMGLSNLGNTCFMNSALQCLSNTAPLTKYFLKGSWQSELNPDNPLGMKGQVAEAYAELISQLWRPDGQRGTSYSPRGFKLTIGRFNPMFAGYSQQDSQELLGFLIDGLHEDLNRIKKKPYIEVPDMDGESDETIAAKTWEIYCMRNDSVIVDLFQGQYKSRVECTKCGKLSITFDPYMFLSVPIPDHREVEVSLTAMPKVAPSGPRELETPVRLFLSMPRDTSIAVLKSMVAKRMRWKASEAEHAIVVNVGRNRVLRVLENSEMVNAIHSYDDIWVVEHEEPDWDMWEVPYADRVETNIKRCAVWTTSMHDSRDRLNQVYGPPIMITIPAKLVAYAPVSRVGAKRRSTQEQRTALLREIFRRIYREVVRALRKYAKIPLYTLNGFTRIQEVYQMLESYPASQNKSDLPIDEDRPAPQLPVSWDDIGEDCEPIIDLFRLKWSSESYNGGPNWVDILYEGPSEYQYRLRDQAEKEETSTDADDEGSDPEPMTVDTPFRRPRGFSKSEFRRPSLTESSIYSDRHRHAEIVPLSEADINIYMEWTNDCYQYVVDNRTLEDSQNERLKSEYEARQKLEKKSLSLQDCLNEYRKEEMLGEDNSWYCPRCKEHRPTKKKLDIWTVPEILVFHLKRFSNTGRGYRSIMGDKIDCLVDAPIQGLDLTDVVLGKHPARKWHSNESIRRTESFESESMGLSEELKDKTTISSDEMTDVADEEEPLTAGVGDDRMAATPQPNGTHTVVGNGHLLSASATDADTSEPMDSAADDDDNQLVYDLFAVSNHFGGLGGGHYTAYAKNCLDDQWYNFDDSQVTKTDESQIMTSAAYMLFYQRRRKGPKTDLTPILDEYQAKLEAEQAASAAAKAIKTSGYFLAKPSAPLRASPTIRSSSPYGLGLVSPNTTSADTTHNNSRNNSRAASPDGSITDLDAENGDRKATEDIKALLNHGVSSAPHSPVGSPLHSEATSFRPSAVGFDFGLQNEDSESARATTPILPEDDYSSWTSQAQELQSHGEYTPVPLTEWEATRLSEQDEEVEDVVLDLPEEGEGGRRGPQAIDIEQNEQTEVPVAREGHNSSEATKKSD